MKVMDEYLDSVNHGGATIFPQQIPKDYWKKFHATNARDKEQYAKGHIPVAINLEWQPTLAQRQSVFRGKLVCNTGSLSTHAYFALRIAGWDNVRILQGIMLNGKPKMILTPE